MLAVELTPYGVDDSIKYAKDILYDALGRKVSKRRKDEAIYRAVGALDAWYALVSISKFEDVTDYMKRNEEDTQND